MMSESHGFLAWPTVVRGEEVYMVYIGTIAIYHIGLNTRYAISIVV